MSFYTEDQCRTLDALFGGDCPYHQVLREFGVFVEKTILPLAPRLDTTHEFPRQSWQRLREQGFFAMPFPEWAEGLGLPFVVYVGALELLAKGCAATALSAAIHNTATQGVLDYGNETLKENFLKAMVTGEFVSAFALTEPGSGSDAAALKTRAHYADCSYRLEGSKSFISNAGVADLYFVFARTDKGISAFLVHKGDEGFQVGGLIEKLGVRGSPTGLLYFDGCRVPKERLVGEEGEGDRYLKAMLNTGRVTVAAISVGIAEAAFEKSFRYSLERRQFGRPLYEFQMTQDKLATLSTRIAAARKLTYHAATLKDRTEDFALEASQAKLLAAEVSQQVSLEAIQIHGGVGYADETDVHRHVRDALLMSIGEGTSEIQKLLIARLDRERYGFRRG
ncbi:MAG: acyl-CoA dehydrogenase family protein [Nitrospinota bacterium]